MPGTPVTSVVTVLPEEFEWPSREHVRRKREAGVGAVAWQGFKISEELKLKEAAASLARDTSDLIGPRPEDKIAGQLSSRFYSSIGSMLDSGDYRSDRCIIVRVPKSDFATRPAALLSVGDRTVYSAFVSSLAARAEKYMVSQEVCFWPRQIDVPKRWEAFLNWPLDAGFDYVVKADVVSFYDSIDHRKLGKVLIDATGRRVLVEKLVNFLGDLMGDRRGLPQGHLASDALSTLFLQEVDSSMVKEGYAYVRHGDDIRVGARNYSEARSSLLLLEDLVRERGLVLASSKCTILKSEHYREEISSGKAPVEVIREKLLADTVARLKSSEDLLLITLNLIGEFDIARELFYEEAITFEEAIERIKPKIRPEDKVVFETIYVQTLEKAPGKPDALNREDFHGTLKLCLTQLAAAGSSAALSDCASLLRSYPDKTRMVCSYLCSRIGSDGKKVAEQVEEFLSYSTFRTAWQEAWVIRSLRGLARESFSDELIAKLEGLVTEQSQDWLPRVEAACTLASVGQLDENLHRFIRRAAPGPLQVDLVEAAVYCRAEQWATNYLDSLSTDSILSVVRDGLISALTK